MTHLSNGPKRLPGEVYAQDGRRELPFASPSPALESTQGKLAHHSGPDFCQETYIVGFQRNPESSVPIAPKRHLPQGRSTRPRTRGERCQP